MNAALHAPMLLGMDMRRSTGYRAELTKYARLGDEASRRGWSVQRLLDWITNQFMDLEFLDAETRDAVRHIAAELGAPYTPLDVVCALCRAALRQMRNGKLVPAVFPGQLSIQKLFGSR